MKKSKIALLLFSSLILHYGCSKKITTGTGGVEPAPAKAVAVWQTAGDKSKLFAKVADISLTAPGAATGAEIVVDESKTFQTMDGFGYTLTGGSAQHLIHMSPAARAALLKELFATDGPNIGVSYLRVSIGASDLNDRVFSYNDLPTGETDVDMKKFSLDPDRADLIPVLKEILAINPDIKILGSPWSPPTWMKDNNNSKGGSLKPEYYDAYAKYFVKYIQGMQAEGIKIDAITIQNEPLHPGNNPSMLMLPQDQAAFIKKSLGPAFAAAGITTKIILYDHNADRPDYPISILNDPEAKKYVDGSAFHLYGGTVDALSTVHNAHPDKNLYFTEQWVGAPGNFPEDVKWHVRTLIIGAPRNWSRNVLEWNLAANSKWEPHTIGGCTECLGAVTIDGDNVVRNPAYYIIAHASKLVRPGSVRIASNIANEVHNVAYKTPDGNKVMIAINDGTTVKQITVKDGQQQFKTDLQPGSVYTFYWK